MRFKIALIGLLILSGCAANKMSSPNRFDLDLAQTNASADIASLDGLLKLTQGNSKEAINAFMQYYFQSGDLSFLKEALRVAFLNGDDRIEQIIAQTEGKFINDSEVCRIKIGHQLHKGDIQAAKTKAEELLKNDSQNASNQTLMGSIYYISNDFNGALKHFKEAYKLDQSEDNATRLADIMVKQNHPLQAIKTLEKFDETTGCTQNACVLLAVLYAQNQNPQKAANMFERLYTQSGNKEHLNNALSALLMYKEFKLAEEFLQKYRINDDILMQIYADQKEFAKAAEIANGLYLATNDQEYYIKSAIYRYENATKMGKKVGKFELSNIANIFAASIKTIELNPIYLNYYGYLLIDHDLDIKKGLELAIKAHEMAPDAAFIIDSVAWGYYKLGECDKANEWYEKIDLNKDFMDDIEAKTHKKAIKKCLTRSRK